MSDAKLSEPTLNDIYNRMGKLEDNQAEIKSEIKLLKYKSGIWGTISSTLVLVAYGLWQYLNKKMGS